MPSSGKNAVHRKLVFSDDLTEDRFEWMRDNLAEALVGSDSIQLELNEVKKADDALIQLICGTHRVAVSLGKSFSLSTEETREVLFRLAESLGYATDPCGKREGGCLYQERDLSQGNGKAGKS